MALRLGFGGGERVDAELERKQEERVRELRAAERKKEREAQQMAGVQKRVDGAPSHTLFFVGN